MQIIGVPIIFASVGLIAYGAAILTNERVDWRGGFMGSRFIAYGLALLILGVHMLKGEI